MSAKNKTPVEPSYTFNNHQSDVLVIIGPTGSGKTGLAIDFALALAKKRGVDVAAEVISADSRAIYKGMDIGTAKPMPGEMQGVPHWGIDLVEPDERFTVVDFQRYARQKITEIQARGHLPIIAGGTGLYVDALVYGYNFTDKAKKTYADRVEIDPRFLIFGISWTKDELMERLRRRAQLMFDNKIEQETAKMAERYSWNIQAMKSNIYPIVWRMMRGELTRDEAIEAFVTDDWHLAKRQLTWFKRTSEIRWVRLDEALQAILDAVDN